VMMLSVLRTCWPIPLPLAPSPRTPPRSSASSPHCPLVLRSDHRSPPSRCALAALRFFLPCCFRRFSPFRTANPDPLTDISAICYECLLFANESVYHLRLSAGACFRRILRYHTNNQINAG